MGWAGAGGAREGLLVGIGPCSTVPSDHLEHEIGLLCLRRGGRTEGGWSNKDNGKLHDRVEGQLLVGTLARLLI